MRIVVTRFTVRVVWADGWTAVTLPILLTSSIDRLSVLLCIEPALGSIVLHSLPTPYLAVVSKFKTPSVQFTCRQNIIIIIMLFVVLGRAADRRFEHTLYIHISSLETAVSAPFQ